METDVRNEMVGAVRGIGIELPRGLRSKASSEELLDISKKIDEFITYNNWSWCDMRQVYRILEVIHG